MSTVAPQQRSSFLPSPRSPSMDEFIDLSAFGSSSSRESSPVHLPNTPELNDPSAASAFAADPFYQSLFAASSIPQVVSGSGNIAAVAALDGLKDNTVDSWGSLDRLLSPSFLGQNSLVDESSAGIDDLALFSNHFTGTSANGGGGAPQGGIFGSPPFTAGSSSSTSFPLEHSESNSSYSTSTAPTFGHPSFAIDPQLVAAPSPVTSIPRSSSINAVTSTTSHAVTASPSPAAPAAASAVTRSQLTQRVPPPPPGRYNEDDDEDDDDEDDDGDLKSVSRGSSLAPSLPPKPAGISAKVATRKSASGIVQTGGITKQRVTSAVVAIDKDPNDTEDWRPTPEEYKKLSSKEKRQLRNKISARNFRVRRKEYITTLESHIADRDQLIEAIRQELGASKLENDELRREVDALKRAMLEGRTTVESLALPPPAPLDANGDPIRPISPISPTSQQQTARSKLNKPNMRKDIAAPGSPAFWGGVGTFAGGVTPVHATLVPDIILPTTRMAPSLSTSDLLSGKVSGWWTRSHTSERENLNPLMNTTPSMFNSPPPSDSESDKDSPRSSPLNHGMSRFDAFMELNPFTIKSADDYKMHLWAQMAAARQPQQNVAQQSQRFAQPSYGHHQHVQNNANNDTGSLLSALRPAFFQSSSPKPQDNSPQSPKSTLAALLSGKAIASSMSTASSSPYAPSSKNYPVLQSSPRQRPSQSSTSNGPTQQQAYAVALASQTLLSRLSSAFWDAFSGSNTTSQAVTAPRWDAEKVRKVLEGRAVVRIVDVDPSPSLIDEKEGLGLEEKMRSLSLSTNCASEKVASSVHACKCPPECLNEVAGVFTNLRK